MYNVHSVSTKLNKCHYNKVKVCAELTTLKNFPNAASDNLNFFYLFC